MISSFIFLPLVFASRSFAASLLAVSAVLVQVRAVPHLSCIGAGLPGLFFPSTTRQATKVLLAVLRSSVSVSVSVELSIMSSFELCSHLGRCCCGAAGLSSSSWLVDWEKERENLRLHGESAVSLLRLSKAGSTAVRKSQV